MAGSHGVGWQQLVGSGKVEHSTEWVPRQQGYVVFWGQGAQVLPLRMSQQPQPWGVHQGGLQGPGCK